MTTKTDIPRHVLEERWLAATTRPVKFKEDGNGVSWDLSERWHQIDDALNEFAALLVEDGFSDDKYDDPDGVLPVTERIWQVIHDELIAWAERQERGRWYPRGESAA